MWVKVCKDDALLPGNATEYLYEKERIAVFRTADGYYAIDNVCPHQGALLNEGVVRNNRVTCPWHAWSFGLKDGVCNINARLNLETYPVKLEEGFVWLDPSNPSRIEK